MITLQINPKKIALQLFLLTLALLLINISGQIIGILLAHRYGSTLLDLAQKQSIFRFYTTLMLMICSGVLLLIAIGKKSVLSGHTWNWLGLSLIFLVMALVKDTSVDEQLVVFLGSLFGISKYVIYVLAYGVALILIPALFLKFLLRLPKPTLRRLIIGVVTFLVGAFVLDLVTSYFWKVLDHRSVTYIGFTSLEVLFEISGIVILIYAFLSYFVSEMNLKEIVISDGE